MPLALRRVVLWAFAVGFVSFLAGFIGPIIFTPGANQGPMLGIFITGPLGTVVGFVVGIIREARGYTATPMEVVKRWKQQR